MKLSDLPLKSHERVFFERVPLPTPTRARRSCCPIRGTTPSWPRRSRRGDSARSRAAASRSIASRPRGLWLETEYRPVVAMLREADLIGDATETEAYMRIAAERYRLLRTHDWSEDVLRQVVRGPAAAGATCGADLASASLAAQ